MQVRAFERYFSLMNVLHLCTSFGLLLHVLTCSLYCNERTNSLSAKPSSLIWHLMQYLFLFTESLHLGDSIFLPRTMAVRLSMAILQLSLNTPTVVAGTTGQNFQPYCFHPLTVMKYGVVQVSLHRQSYR